MCGEYEVKLEKTLERENLALLGRPIQGHYKLRQQSIQITGTRWYNNSKNVEKQNLLA